MRLADLFQQSLSDFSLTDRALEVEILLEKSFGLTRPEFWAKKNEPVTDHFALRQFRSWVDRLTNHEPLTYIIGEKEFYSRMFSITPGVLIPRPETEHLVETALALSKQDAEILDVGAGSGIISITLALESGCLVTALDCSRKALKLLQKNIDRHGVQKIVTPLYGNLFPKFSHCYDLIVSNPPYLTQDEWNGLPPNIRCFEPRRALLSGPEGTEVIRRIIRRAPKYLKKGGSLILETGAGQRPQVDLLLSEAGFTDRQWHIDYQGHDRVVSARK